LFQIVQDRLHYESWLHSIDLVVLLHMFIPWNPGTLEITQFSLTLVKQTWAHYVKNRNMASKKSIWGVTPSWQSMSQWWAMVSPLTTVFVNRGAY
jgi:hypothetical protein